MENYRLGRLRKVLARLILGAALLPQGPHPVAGLPADCVAIQGTPGSGGAIYIDVGATAGGGDQGGARPRPPFVADGPYSAARGFGWLGPAEIAGREPWFVNVFPLGTSTGDHPGQETGQYEELVAPYLSWIRLRGYRVHVPDGVYRVTLLLLEPEYPEPGLRVFDVASRGTVLISDLDLAAVAGQDELVRIALQVDSRDGAIELEFRARSQAPPLLAGLVVEPAEPTVPAPPSDLEVRAGAGEILLRWALPRTAPRGWIVSRSVNGGPFEAASAGILPLPVFVDRGRSPDEVVVYRVSAVDASCAVGRAAESPPVSARAAGDFGLPVIDITVDESEFAAIHLQPTRDLEIPATVRSGAEQASGTIRLRGGSTRWLSKRSFRLKFTSGQIDGRTRLKLLAETPDPTRLRQLVGYDLLARMGALAPRARPVLVRINGRNYGVYDDIEHVGDAFLESRGYEGQGDRFRVYDTFRLQVSDADTLDLSGYEKKENRRQPSPELEALIIWLNTAAMHQVDAGLADRIEVGVFIDYLAGQLLMANYDYIDGGHYLAHLPSDNRFLLIPWDLNNDTWSRAALSLSNGTLFDIGPEPGWWDVNWLWTRALASAPFRERLADRLAGLLSREFGEAMHRAIDATYADIRPALAVEPWVWRRRYERWLAEGPEQIHHFVAQRREYVRQAARELPLLGETSLVLAEVAVGPGGFIELENRSSRAVDLSDCWLSDEPLAPLKMSLARRGTIRPRARLILRGGGVRPAAAGGFLSLGCSSAEGNIGDDPERAFRLNSFVFYPPLAEGTAYVHRGTRWTVGRPSPGVPGPALPSATVHLPLVIMSAPISPR